MGKKLFQKYELKMIFLVVIKRYKKKLKYEFIRHLIFISVAVCNIKRR